MSSMLSITEPSLRLYITPTIAPASPSLGLKAGKLRHRCLKASPVCSEQSAYPSTLLQGVLPSYFTRLTCLSSSSSKASFRDTSPPPRLRLLKVRVFKRE